MSGGFDVPSFLEYTVNIFRWQACGETESRHQSKATLQLHSTAVPFRAVKQADRIVNGTPKFAKEVLSISL